MGQCQDDFGFREGYIDLVSGVFRISIGGAKRSYYSAKFSKFSRKLHENWTESR